MLFVGAAVVVCMAGIYTIGGIVAPVFLALTLVLTVRPLVTWLNGHHVPKLLSGFIGLITVYVVLAMILLAITFALTQFIQAVPQFAPQAQQLYSQLSSLLTSFGVSQEAIRAFLVTFDFTRLIGLATGLFGQITGSATFVFTLVLFIAFVAVDLIDVSERSRVLNAVRPNLAAALVDFSWRVRKYWIVATIFGIAVALINMGILAWLQIPLVLTWGILAFVTAYIPNVGFIIGMVPPAVMALLAKGWQTMVIMVVAYVVVNFIASMIIQPKVTGDAVGLNISTTFASLIFWAIILGPMGPILAVPLTLFFKGILFDSEVRTRWLSVFLGGDLDDVTPGESAPPLQAPPVVDDPDLPSAREQNDGPHDVAAEPAEAVEAESVEAADAEGDDEKAEPDDRSS